MKKQIEILARGVCVMGGDVLLCHAKRAKITYLPGGHVEFHESAPEALIREMKEEMGLNASVDAFLGVVEHSFRQRGERHCEINLTFQMRIPKLKKQQPLPSCEDHIEFLWVPLSRLREARLEPAVLREVLPGWLKRRGPASGWCSTM